MMETNWEADSAFRAPYQLKSFLNFQIKFKSDLSIEQSMIESHRAGHCTLILHAHIHNFAIDAHHASFMN